MALLREFIDNIFNNPPVLIEAPRAVKMHYSDVGTRVEAFNVRLFYKNGQRKDFTFPIDNDHWKIVSQEKAFHRAYSFYLRKCKKIVARNEKTK